MKYQAAEPATATPTNIFSRRQFIQAAFALPVLFALPKPANAASSIHMLEGQVFINNKLADYNTLVRVGDKITVSHDGKFAFRLGGDAFLLRGGTALELERSNNLLLGGLRLLTGGLLAVFEKRKKPLLIHTNIATIGIRGTGVYISTQPYQLYTCTCYGETSLSVGKQHELISATHHNAHTAGKNEQGVMAMQATQVIDHTDEELRMLESLVERKPPLHS